MHGCEYDPGQNGGTRPYPSHDHGGALKRTVIITGGTKGLGRETVLAFGRAGYCVLALYASDDCAAQNFRHHGRNKNAWLGVAA